MKLCELKERKKHLESTWQLEKERQSFFSFLSFLISICPLHITVYIYIIPYFNHPAFSCWIFHKETQQFLWLEFKTTTISSLSSHQNVYISLRVHTQPDADRCELQCKSIKIKIRCRISSAGFTQLYSPNVFSYVAFIRVVPEAFPLSLYTTHCSVMWSIYHHRYHVYKSCVHSMSCTNVFFIKDATII